MKNLKTLGVALTKSEQKNVFGGQVLAIHRCGTRCYTLHIDGCRVCPADGSWRKPFKIPPNG